MYRVIEIFHSIQGEGFHAGTPAVFVRFAGCNAWSGREEDRNEPGPVCRKFCDTKFRFPQDVRTEAHGRVYADAAELVGQVVALLAGRPTSEQLVVLTGGEPALQVDSPLLHALLDEGFLVSIETNGSIRLPPAVTNCWLTLSPKPPLAAVAQPTYAAGYSEVKVVYPVAGLNPLDYAAYGSALFIQPVDLDQGPSAAQMNVYAACMEFVHNNPGWRVTSQMHKLFGVD